MVRTIALLVTIAASFTLATAPAMCAQAAWMVVSSSSPTNFVPGDESGDDTYVLKAINTGIESSDGTRIEVADTLPAGVTATSISGEDLGKGRPLSCKLGPSLGCDYEGEVAPGDVLQVTVVVDVKSDAVSPAVNSVTVTGGGAASPANGSHPTTIGSTPADFGVSGFTAASSSDEAGDTTDFTVDFALNQVEEQGEYQPAALPKDLEITLPSGFFPSALDNRRCEPAEVEDGNCTREAVGVVVASINSSVGGPLASYSSPIYNVVPDPGEPAALMFKLGGAWVWVEVGIRAEDGYRMSLRARNMPEITGLLSMDVTLWPSLRGPSACGAPAPMTTLSVDSWLESHVVVQRSFEGHPEIECDHLPFAPTLAVSPDVVEAGAPSGYEVDLNMPVYEGSAGLSPADMKDVLITLPPGTALSPAGTDGLASCSETQFGLSLSTPPSCLNASKIGNAEVTTPLLSMPLLGSVFMASEVTDPLGPQLAIYLVAEGDGVALKLAGELDTSPLTGQLSIVFHEVPQLPLASLRLHFFGGSRALLSNPPSCGVQAATSYLTSWSGDSPVESSTSFGIEGCSYEVGPEVPTSSSVVAGSIPSVSVPALTTGGPGSANHTTVKKGAKSRARRVCRLVRSSKGAKKKRVCSLERPSTRKHAKKTKKKGKPMKK